MMPVADLVGLEFAVQLREELLSAVFNEHALGTPIIVIQPDLSDPGKRHAEGCQALGASDCLGTQRSRHEAEFMTEVLQLDIFLFSKGFRLEFGAETGPDSLPVGVPGDQILVSSVNAGCDFKFTSHFCSWMDCSSRIPSLFASSGCRLKPV